jgi:uncharacterized integral membrane protein
LVRVFEALFVSHERKDGTPPLPLTAEQLSQVLKLQAEREQRDHEARAQRDRHRHELAILKQREKSEAAARDGELKSATLTYLPRLAVILVAVVLAGVAVIVSLLAAFGAKDQLPVILAFVSGLVGGALAGFGGGYASGKASTPAP